MNNKAIVVFSGGPDSTAAALWAQQSGYDVELVTFQFRNAEQYGELKASFKVAEIMGLKHTIFDFRSPMQHFSTSSHAFRYATREH